MTPSKTDPRRIAYDVLRRIHDDDAYSHLALSAALDASVLEGPDRGLATELTYGVCTWRRAIDLIIDRVVDRGITSLDDELLDVLRLAVYQLRFLDRIPDHAALNESVDLAREVAGEAATGLTNAVLRRISREKDRPWWRESDEERKPARWLGERYSLPSWISNRLIQRFGRERAIAIAAAFTTRPPLWTRVVGAAWPDAAKRYDSLDETARAALEAGTEVVQDLGSQLGVRWTGVEPAERVLDACAGLGGKTLQLAEVARAVVAIDPQRSKLELLEKAARRVGVAEPIEVERTKLQDYEPAELFDGVLVDAPCTGLGVLRRHPETRWRRRQADVTALAAEQSDLLDHAAQLVVPGGWLTYAVCTWTREETTKQAEQFVERHPEFAVDREIGGRLDRPDDSGYLRTMPDTDDADGFFAVRFVRRTE